MQRAFSRGLVSTCFCPLPILQLSSQLSHIKKYINQERSAAASSGAWLILTHPPHHTLIHHTPIILTAIHRIDQRRSVEEFLCKSWFDGIHFYGFRPRRNWYLRRHQFESRTTDLAIDGFWRNHSFSLPAIVCRADWPYRSYCLFFSVPVVPLEAEKHLL